MGVAPANSYDSVAHSHVVPAGYLRAWAHAKQIAMRRPGTTQSVLVGVKDAGVRTNFYRRARPETGETIYDVEWSLARQRRRRARACCPAARTPAAPRRGWTPTCRAAGGNRRR